MRAQFITAAWVVTEADLLAAHRWADSTITSNGTPFMGNQQTIENDNGLHIIDGALGEVLFQRNVCPTAVKLEGTQIGSDFAIGNTGIRVDVKTKRRKGPLQPYYVAEVDLAQQHHATDWYAFMSLDTINWVMEYIACISKKHFWELGWPMEAGTELVAPGGQLHPVKKTCYHLDAQTIYQNAQFLPNHFIQQKPKPKTTTMAQENKPKSFIMRMAARSKSSPGKKPAQRALGFCLANLSHLGPSRATTRRPSRVVPPRVPKAPTSNPHIDVAVLV